MGHRAFVCTECYAEQKPDPRVMHRNERFILNYAIWNEDNTQLFARIAVKTLCKEHALAFKREHSGGKNAPDLLF